MNWIFILIISIIVFFIILKITKKILVAISLFFLITTILALVFGFILYKDFTSFKKGFENGEKLILLVDESKVYTGVNLVKPVDPRISYISQEEIDMFSGYYQNNELDKILYNKSFMFLIKKDLIENELDYIYLGDSNLSNSEAMQILTLDQYLEDFYSKINHQEKTPYDIRADIFLSSISRIAEIKSPLFLLEGYKNGQIKIYPESLTLKFIKMIPSGLIMKVIQDNSK
nr:hypothetical protein [Candidatus Woesearchaeota archaeon]